MSFKKWFPSYLWYSGILMQALMVIMGLYSLIAAVDRRPAHTLYTQLFQRLNEQDFCDSVFKGQDFAWKDPKDFQANMMSDKAMIEKLSYANKGSVGRTSEGYHVYRLQFEANIKDLSTNEVVRFPPRNERLVEVDARNRIVACHPEMNARNLAANHLQEARTQACEKPGWKRRLLCDEGSERCYPMSLCEKG